MVVSCALCVDKQTVGLAFVSTQDPHVFFLLELSDTDDHALLAGFLLESSPRECVIAEGSSPGIVDLLEQNDVSILSLKKIQFSFSKSDTKRLLKEPSVLEQLDLPLALNALSALMDHLKLLSDADNFGQFDLQKHQLKNVLQLDATLMKALHLLPNPKDAGRNMNLLGLLNHCKTPQGTRLLETWIRQPLANQSDILQRQDICETLIQETVLRQSLQENHLKALPDFLRISKKFGRTTGHLQGVVRMYQAVIRLPGLIDVLECNLNNHIALFDVVYVSKLKSLTESLANFRELVETTIDLKAADAHEYRIKPDFDATLQSIRQSMDDTVEQMNHQHDKVLSQLGLEGDKKLKFEKSPIYGYHFRLTRTDANMIRNKKEYMEIATQKSGVLFTTAELRQLSQSFDDLSRQYDIQQQTVVKEILQITSTYCPVLETLNQVIAHLDVMTSLAHAAVIAPIPYQRPKLIPKGGNVTLKASRHPCLEAQDGISFIPNDVIMERGKSSFQIVTGPNMGGKSTYIRQVGVIAVMTQIGSFVPCREAELPIFDTIMARVGAGDSQLKGVSTFMAEMLETSAILKNATKDALIIIDELGRGTSTYDGFGLAWSIAEHIAKNIHCFALFATHFHELTVLADQVPDVCNRHVLVHATENEMTLLYKVQDGICDQSFGIHVAEMVQFPQSVIKLAKRKADELENIQVPGFKLWKCNESENQEGYSIIEQFLRDFKAIHPQDLAHKLPDLKSNYQALFDSNVFIQQVLSSF